MPDPRNPTNWAVRHRALSESMHGFDGLILAMQGLLVGISLATGEIWVTPDVSTTLTIARSKLIDVWYMTGALGYEQ